jgi:DNA-binding response OmpR family regulator
MSAKMDHAAAVLLVGASAEALRARLELSGYRPLPTARLPAPMEQASTEAPRAVILAPDQAGRIAELRQRWPMVPVLLGIEQDSVEGRCRCLSSGADDFWLTSLGPSDLLTRLRLHLSRPRPQPPSGASLQVADLVVQPDRQLVRRGNRLVTLTARELQLLLVLLQHRGKVVDRDVLLREIWHDQPSAASNVLEVYVRYLRQKLEEAGERRLIHTVRGRGYCLAERLPRPLDPQR